MNIRRFKGLCCSYEAIQKTAEFIRSRTTLNPTVGIICGSGLGKLASAVKNPQLIKYEDIPNFPRTNVVGHEGNLIFGTLGGKSVMVMQGRFHLYEGYGNEAIIIPIRLMKILGVETILVSNAAGGLNRNLKLGDLVIIRDHISFPGLALKNVLIGPNDERFGTRFVATSDAYDVKLRRAFQRIVQQQGHSNIVHEGVYVHVGGPTYESPAENRMLMLMGADVVGMSTVPEVIVARHAGIRVFAISLVTNVSVLSEETTEKANHQEVLDVATTRTELLSNLFTELIKQT
ncbi:purine-nucleoside phosphorylase [Paragonimus westermani]|uniref:Purine nucleoside phosphorylase n=1 Tax=Paragonimus westermani TaxID=34504 RepID=A0A5J4NR34_9TREM|nr:purine-nucleoside phosphorylase [Paragonimus westermani]